MSTRNASARIEQNIRDHGYHVYIVGAGQSPRFAYTIGCAKTLGVELVFAGGMYFMAREVGRIVGAVAQRPLSAGLAPCVVGELGQFSLREVDGSWADAMLLGALSYYKVDSVPAIQIVPDAAHMTIDVPDMSRVWSSASEPIWRWIRDEKWPFSVPPTSVVATDLAALRGGTITEVARWEENEWEMFTVPGPDVKRDEMRIVPIATLVAGDSSLRAAMDLEIGHGLSRAAAQSQWVRWRSAPTN